MSSPPIQPLPDPWEIFCALTEIADAIKVKISGFGKSSTLWVGPQKFSLNGNVRAVWVKDSRYDVYTLGRLSKENCKRLAFHLQKVVEKFKTPPLIGFKTCWGRYDPITDYWLEEVPASYARLVFCDSVLEWIENVLIYIVEGRPPIEAEHFPWVDTLKESGDLLEYVIQAFQGMPEVREGLLQKALAEASGLQEDGQSEASDSLMTQSVPAQAEASEGLSPDPTEAKAECIEHHPEAPGGAESAPSVVCQDADPKMFHPRKAPRRGRPRRYNPEQDARLLADWEAASNQGTTLKEFAKHKGIGLKELWRALERARKRRKESQ